MKFQILFSGKNKKNISKCRLLKFLPRVLRVKTAVAFVLGLQYLLRYACYNKVNVARYNTVITQSIGTPYLLTIPCPALFTFKYWDTLSTYHTLSCLIYF